MRATILACFAVPEEAAIFRKHASRFTALRVLVTGMGQHNAEQSFRTAITTSRPELVLTCGFAGGLNPELHSGTVVFETSGNSSVADALTQAGARPVRFHCSRQVITSAEAKRALRESSGADAVEMESGFIHAICREQKIPSVTVRVILDAADEDLPLDFNSILTPDHKISAVKLAGTLLRCPSKIPALLQLQKQSRAAAACLSGVLIRALDILLQGQVDQPKSTLS